jgi:hypothetical protein
LVEADNPPFCRVKPLAVAGLTATPWPPVQHQHREALRVAAFFHVQRVAVANTQHVGGVGFKWYVQLGGRVNHSPNLTPFMLGKQIKKAYFKKAL